MLKNIVLESNVMVIEDFKIKQSLVLPVKIGMPSLQIHIQELLQNTQIKDLKMEMVTFVETQINLEKEQFGATPQMVKDGKIVNR